MSVLSAVQTYIKNYSGLATGAPVWVNNLGVNPTEYGIVPLPGSRVVEWYLDKSSLREFSFAFELVNSTADDVERLKSSDFFETFADWLESQTESEAFPTLGAKQTAYKIEALGWGYLDQQGESNTGIYLIQCKLTYQQSA